MTKFTDMSKSQGEADMASPCLPTNKYPYGLCISLCEDELEKLGVEEDDLEVGNIIDLRAFALVTSKSENATVDGDSHCRIELQITHMALENEDDEDEEKEPETKPYW